MDYCGNSCNYNFRTGAFKTLSRVKAKPLQEFINQKPLTEAEMPGFRSAFLLRYCL